jgi:uncharacterized membrane protein
MSILKELPELIKAEIISQETAEKIRFYYKSKGNTSSNRLFVLFAVLGAILIGLGIILILAHNWDIFPRAIKISLTFLPLFIGQLLCVYSLLKKDGDIAWKESSAAFLFLSVGASIALVSQIYQLPGNVGAFVFTWMLLCLPLMFIMKSSISSLLFLLGISYYACHQGYWGYPSENSYMYWVLLFASLIYYFRLYKFFLFVFLMVFE